VSTQSGTHKGVSITTVRCFYTIKTNEKENNGLPCYSVAVMMKSE